jgi:hypothetical protein
MSASPVMMMGNRPKGETSNPDRTNTSEPTTPKIVRRTTGVPKPVKKTSRASIGKKVQGFFFYLF